MAEHAEVSQRRGIEAEALQEPTQVVACGHPLSDADGCGSHRDDEHLVVALKDGDTRLLRGCAC